MSNYTKFLRLKTNTGSFATNSRFSSYLELSHILSAKRHGKGHSVAGLFNDIFYIIFHSKGIQTFFFYSNIMFSDCVVFFLSIKLVYMLQTMGIDKKIKRTSFKQRLGLVRTGTSMKFQHHIFNRLCHCISHLKFTAVFKGMICIDIPVQLITLDLLKCFRSQRLLLLLLSR